MSDPREGLPPCLKGVAVFGERQATWHDADICPDGPHQGHHVCWGIVGEERYGDDIHPPLRVLLTDSGECSGTDDPIEAQVAFERGAEWVRTGEGP